MSHSITPALILTIWPPFFEQVHSGEKTVEGRPFTSRYEHLKEGDLIQIVDKGCCNNFAVEITRLTKYGSFSEMLEKEGVSNCLPGVESLEKGVATYRSFPNYEAQERQYGVIALGIKVYQASSNVALYRNNLKNQNFEEQPTQPKTDSSGCFGISHPSSTAQSFTSKTVTADPNSHSNDVPGSNPGKEEARGTSEVKKVAKRQFETGDLTAKKQKKKHGERIVTIRI